VPNQAQAAVDAIDALLKRDLAHPIESVGKRLRARMSWLNQAPSDKAA
jgi:ketol-acid reductoisomerase